MVSVYAGPATESFKNQCKCYLHKRFYRTDCEQFQTDI